jgi:hypothetical protein
LGTDVGYFYSNGFLRTCPVDYFYKNANGVCINCHEAIDALDALMVNNWLLI